MISFITFRADALRTRALAASAAVLGVILALQLGAPEREAQATSFPSMGDVASSGDFTMMTLPANNEDLLIVLDGRNETLFAYRIKNKSMFERVAGGDLRLFFAEGRRIGAGVK